MLHDYNEEYSVVRKYGKSFLTTLQAGGVQNTVGGLPVEEHLALLSNQSWARKGAPSRTDTRGQLLE